MSCEGWVCPICRLTVAPWMFICPNSPHRTALDGMIVLFEYSSNLPEIEAIKKIEEEDRLKRNGGR